MRDTAADGGTVSDERPTLAECVHLAADGAGTLTVESAAIVWRPFATDEHGRGTTLRIGYASTKDARAALAHARAWCHLNPREAA